MNYEVIGMGMYRRDDEGNAEQMSNFVAEITEETHFVDGTETTKTELTIEGSYAVQVGDPPKDEVRSFKPAVINATEFASMGWVMPLWGVKAVIRPGTSIKDDLRAAIQIRSKPKVRTIYKHTGWARISEKRNGYLHAGGAITSSGNEPSVNVALPPEMMLYDLRTEVKPAEAVAATLDLMKLGPPEIMYPILAATLTPLFGPVDFAAHVTGRTGTYKSEVMSLFQSHYGPGMDARHLPGSWSSTGNALEAQAYIAKNAAFVVDDFIPSGTSWQVRQFQSTADKIIRAQGNQAGRARLTDVSSLQTTLYPRGIVLSTGEDTPEGHSVRARMLIMELSPGDITPERLTAAQANRHKYVGTVAALAQVLAARTELMHQIVARTAEWRTFLQTVGHSRTPAMLGRLIATLELFLTLALEQKWIGKAEHKKHTLAGTNAIKAIGETQARFLEEMDPVDTFLAAIRQVVGTGGGHFRTLAGGIPKFAGQLGWTELRDDNGGDGNPGQFKSRGPTLGWVIPRDNELLLDITAGYNIVKKAAGNDLSFTKQTMLKRLKEAGTLTRSDETRERNTVRVTAEGHTRTAIALVLSDVLDTTEAKAKADAGKEEQIDE